MKIKIMEGKEMKDKFISRNYEFEIRAEKDEKRRLEIAGRWKTEYNKMRMRRDSARKRMGEKSGGREIQTVSFAVGGAAHYGVRSSADGSNKTWGFSHFLSAIRV